MIAEAAKFAHFLYDQRLQALWLEWIEEQARDHRLATLDAQLVPLARSWAARELPQSRNMASVHEALSAQGIEYFFAKGAHLRYVLYEDPALRSAIDVDVFVRPADREPAIAALESAGFEARPAPETLSHEIKLTRYRSDVDLHWDLFRPGRLRPGVLDWLFERREPFRDWNGLDATASLFVMLVHPAITKYLASPTSILIHLVDQALLIRSGNVEWEELANRLDRFGGRTAAWSSLYLLGRLAAVRAPVNFEQRLRPSGFKAWYLRQWIDRAWITRWFDRRWLVAGFFSLALQDNWSDRLRALRSLRSALNSYG